MPDRRYVHDVYNQEWTLPDIEAMITYLTDAMAQPGTPPAVLRMLVRWANQYEHLRYRLRVLERAQKAPSPPKGGERWPSYQADKLAKHRARFAESDPVPVPPEDSV